MTHKYERKGRQIKNLESGDVKDFDSINEAKRHSRTLPPGELRRVSQFTKTEAADNDNDS